MRIYHLLETASDDFDPVDATDNDHRLRTTRGVLNRYQDVYNKLENLQTDGIIGMHQNIGGSRFGVAASDVGRDWHLLSNYAANAVAYSGPDEPDEEKRRQALLAVKLDKQLGDLRDHMINTEKFGKISHEEERQLATHLNKHILRLKGRANYLKDKYKWNNNSNDANHLFVGGDEITSGMKSQWERVFHYQTFEVWAHEGMATEPPVVEMRKLQKQVTALVTKIAHL